ncbi:MAG TPA: ankyrin repeat domain-containing protein [Pyrinomonadaceae bacterium]|nr:ankyrin repeat domain-containing protein [Pyrinomonadaceae bacterium]
MMTSKNNRPLWTIVLALSMLCFLAGCANDSVETRSVSSPPKTGTPLTPPQVEMLEVAAKGNNARIKELLDGGVDVNMRGNDNNTPLMEAAYAGHIDTVKLLLDHGGDLSAKKNDGATATGLAGRTKNVVDLLKSVTALVEAAGKGDNEMLKGLIEKGTPINGLDEGGNSALAAASYAGKTDTVKLLLDKGAKANIKKADGETPLSLATAQKHPEIVTLLNDAIAKQAKGAAPKAAPAK